ncbi:MAG: hypothetical protein AAF962_18335 [Actinomycetota bacterium]
MTDTNPSPGRRRRPTMARVVKARAVPAVMAAGPLLAAGCGGGAAEPTAVVWSINDDATVSLCDDEGLRTYQLSDDGLTAGLREGVSVRFEVEAGTDDDEEPVLTVLQPAGADEEYSC